MLSAQILSDLADYKTDGIAVATGFLVAVLLTSLFLIARRAVIGASDDVCDDLSSNAELLHYEGEADYRRILSENGWSDDQIEADLAAAYDELGLDPSNPDDYDN